MSHLALFRPDHPRPSKFLTSSFKFSFPSFSAAPFGQMKKLLFSSHLHSLSLSLTASSFQRKTSDFELFELFGLVPKQQNFNNFFNI